ncbi:SDR family oxidoreductase [Flagellimonas sp. DF-77]|uniref:SDR family oxidoreductase n=1 Tax=Flagellimonas algarum TaxID=3230298 RepID=UPI00339314F2
MEGLEGKVAYITGGSKGIGLGIAQALLDIGMKVAISARSEHSLEAAAKLLGQERVLYLVADVSNFEQEEAAVSRILETWDALDVVIANAGVGHFAAVDELSLEAWDQMIATNLSGAFHTLKAAVPALKNSQGYYLSIASLAGTNFFAKGAGYNASKFGLVGFTQAAMLDLRQYGIKVSIIMPGSVATYFNGNEPSDKDAWKIQPEDLGQIVVDLLKMNPRTLPSKVEVRPSRPDLK